MPKMSETKAKKKKADQPIVLKDWNAVSAYLAKKLKPVSWGPKGQPIYDDEEVKALNIQLADPS
jgi:hypothetical protein